MMDKPQSLLDDSPLVGVYIIATVIVCSIMAISAVIGQWVIFGALGFAFVLESPIAFFAFGVFNPYDRDFNKVSISTFTLGSLLLWGSILGGVNAISQELALLMVIPPLIAMIYAVVKMVTEKM